MSTKRNSAGLKTMAILVLAATWAIGAPSILAAPSVSGTSGTFTQGQSITISGSSFGSHSNYNSSSNSWSGQSFLMMDFKDFEDGSLTSEGFSGNDMSDVSLQSGGPTNSTKYERTQYGSSRLANYGISRSDNSTNPAIYTSFWFMMPSGTEGGKPWRWYFGSNSSSDNLYLGTQCGSSGLNLSGDFLGTTVYGASISTGVWHKLEIYASKSAGVYTVWLDGAQYQDWSSAKGSNPWSAGGSFDNSAHTIEYADMIDGTTTGCSSTGSYNYDDIYIDRTPARVEICPGSTWSSRGACNTQIPTAWSASSITIEVNKGNFAANSSAYLYVVDSSNTANSSGYAIQFGSGSSSTPPTPTGLHLVN